MPTDTIARALAARIPAQPPNATLSINAPFSIPAVRGDAGVCSDAAGNVYVLGGSTSTSNASGTGTAYKIAPDGTTTTLPNLPTALSYHGAGIDSSGRLYVFGGFANSNYSAATWRYDPANSSAGWVSIAAMPQALAQMGYASDAQGRIYSIGGYNENTATASVANVYRLDTTSGTWASVTSLPTDRFTLAAAAGGGYIYAAGGFQATEQVSSTTGKQFYRFDISTGSWSTLPAMAAGRSAPGMAVDASGRVYVAGGQTPSTTTGNYLSDIVRYDPATGTWATLSIALSVARNNIGSARDNSGRVLFVGGIQSGSGAVATIDRITPESSDLVTSGWSTKAALPAARYGNACGTDGTLIYLALGYVGGALATGLHVVNPATGVVTTVNTGGPAGYGSCGAWCNGAFYFTDGYNSGTQANWYSYSGGTAGSLTSRATRPNGNFYSGAAAIGTSIYLAGGQTSTAGTSATTMFLRYDTTTNTWTDLGSSRPLPSARTQGALVAIGTKLYYLGGYDSTNTSNGAVFCFDTTTSTWSTLTSAPMAIGAYPAAAVGSTIFVMGSTAVSTQVLLTFDTTTSTWSQVQIAPPTAHSINGSAATVGSTLYFLSGQNTANVDAVDAATAGTTPFGRRIKLLQQFLAGTDVAAFSIAKRLPLTPPAANSATWKTAGALPATRYGAAVSSDGTNIYISHGYTNAAKNDGLTFTAGGVSTAMASSSSGQARYGAAGAYCAGMHFAIGGNGATAVDAWQPGGTNGATGGYWTSKAGLINGTMNGAAAVIGRRIYFAGGQGTTSSSTATTNFLRYDADANTWTDLTSTSPLPAARTAGAMVAFNGKLYFLGGNNTSGIPQTNVYIFDPAVGTWSSGPALFEEMDYGGAVVINGVAYISGRYFPSGNSGTEAYGVQTYNLSTGAGAMLTSQPSSSHMSHGAALIGSTLYLVSGSMTANVSAIDPVSGPDYVANVRRLRAVLAA